MFDRSGRASLIAQASSFVIATAIFAGPALAQETRFNIPAQPVGSALQEFSKQSGYRVLFPPKSVSTATSPAIVGRFSTGTVLHMLLKDTPLTIASINGKVVALAVRQPTVSAVRTNLVRTGQAQRFVAQNAAPPAPASVQVEAQPEDNTPPDDIVVVGSQIKGAKVNAALPVTVIGTAEIEATGAVSGDELFRSVPQFGDVTFNSSYIPGSSNSARGDVGSVNLRNLGIGNTLVLLNGRRVVTHPTSQANTQLVPVLSYNTNAIPVNGLERLEVLRDGAAAIYGADAVAGVVNTVLKTDFDGGDMSLQYGGGEGTGFREFNANGVFGKNFAEDRANITVFASYDHGTGLDTTEQSYTASSNRTALFAGTRFEGATSLDARSASTPWASAQTPASFGTVRRGTLALTSASGLFHIQPTTNASCQLGVGNGLCIDDGAIATAGADRNLRQDTAAVGTSVLPRLDRVNLFASGHYDIDDSTTMFFEGGYYLGKTHAEQSPIATLTSIPITIPASNYWNPFGAAVFANGTVNPNRVAGTNVPAAGLPVTLRSYAFTDFGNINVDVKNQQFRGLLGFRGEHKGWNWESAMSYSEATVRDVSDNISLTALAASLAKSTPDAYNFFNGGTIDNPSLGDATPNSAAVIDGLRQKLVRYTKSTLGTFDFRLSRRDLVSLPGGDVGFAAGIEARRETQLDDRDARIDGTITYTDPLTRVTYGDFVNSSINPDTKGHREVFAGYGELAIPAVSPEMGVPLIRNLEFQVAGRFERYSDFGDIAVPKVAGAWDLFKGVRVRGSWAKSFRAPNLEQTNAALVTRSNTRTDYSFCEADLRAARITSFANCARSQLTTAQRAGNPDLNPERANTISFGTVLEPPLPTGFGNLTLTADYWQVKQTGLVGIFGEGNALILDYLLRQNGQTNPNVVRAAVTSDDIAAFAGTGLTPAGQVLFVKDQYVNLLPQTVRGLDLNLIYRTPETSVGRFNLSVNVAHLLKFYQDPSPGIAELLAAREAGTINAGTTITGGGDLKRQNGRPAWKWSGSLTWSLGNVTVGGFTSYIGSVEDTALIDSAGAPWVVDDQITGNLYVDYRFSKGTLDGTSVRVGVRNLTDEKPSLSSDGYLGTLYTPVARYWYANIRHKF